MKRIITLLILFCTTITFSQSNQDLLSHYIKYKKQMQRQGDFQGVINAITHLNILEPNQARTDTLALIYMNQNRHDQALRVLGNVEDLETDSEIAVMVKAFSLKALNDFEGSLVHYEKMFKSKPDPFVAYDMAEMKIRLGDLTGATRNITFGIANSENLMQNFYEMQQPYAVPMKAAFTYLKGLVKFNEDREKNIDAAIAIMNEALAIAPGFNMANVSIEVLNAQKPAIQE